LYLNAYFLQRPNRDLGKYLLNLSRKGDIDRHTSYNTKEISRHGDDIKRFIADDTNTPGPKPPCSGRHSPSMKS
jgi:hypothetical protein